MVEGGFVLFWWGDFVCLMVGFEFFIKRTLALTFLKQLKEVFSDFSEKKSTSIPKNGKFQKKICLNRLKHE